MQTNSGTDKKKLLSVYKERKVKGGVFRIVNQENGRYFLASSPNLAGSINRHNFSVSTGSCIFSALAKDWKQFGAKVFQLEVLEELEKTAIQSDKEFAEDLALLEEIWKEKLEPGLAY